MIVENSKYPKISDTFKPLKLGEYLTRKHDNQKYMIETLQLQPQSMGQKYAFFAICNAKITLAHHETTAKSGSEFVPYAENIFSFFENTIRPFKEQNDGLLSQNIIVAHIPATISDIKLLDRLYVLDGEKPLEECKAYRVESINDDLVLKHYNVDISGVNVLQLTDDTRAGNVDLTPDDDTDDVLPDQLPKWD